MKSTDQSLVSVIVPTYGRPDTLKMAVDSALSQTYEKIEVIVVDDNNPDTESRLETETLMDQYSNNPKVKYIKHSTNKNASAARNTGTNQSEGTYLCYLDDDDRFFSKKIAKQVKYLEDTQSHHAVYCGWIKDYKQTYPKYEGKLIEELLLMEYQPMTSSIMFTRESIEKLNGFDESFKRHQDYEIMLRFFEKYSIGFVNEILLDSGKNQGENMLEGQELENLKEHFFNQFNYHIEILEKDEKNIRKKIYSRHYSAVFWNHINRNYFSLAFNLFTRCFFRSPMFYTKDLTVFLIKHLTKNKK